MIPFLSYILNIFYSIFIKIFKWLKPTRQFIAPYAEIKSIIKVASDEWDLDRIEPETITTISGSSAAAGFFHIQILTSENVHHAYIHIFEDGKLYSGEFRSRASSDQTKIICGPLIVERRVPFRQWRINFRGYLQSSVDDQKIFISIGGWWKSLTNARFFYSNISASTFSDLLPSWKILDNLKTIERYRRSNILHQMGEFHAELKIDGGVAEHRYRGLRERTPIDFETSSTQFSAYLDDGNSFSHKIDYKLRPFAKIGHGLWFKASHNVHPLLLNDELCLDESNQRPIVFDSTESPIELRKSEALSKFSFNRADGKVLNISIVPINFALSQGLGVISRIRETTTSSTSSSDPLEHPQENTASQSELQRHVLPFSHRACQDSRLTGGKGSNLAKLGAITNRFHVPPGIVVTTSAFLQHVGEHPEVERSIRKLDKSGQNPEYYEAIGKEIEQHLLSTSISESLQSSILEWLPSSTFYAVRSSAVGEDGSDLSSAGQLESYLDVEQHDIFEKLKLCWASNFRTEVLNYRRNHGQLLNPPMAVVIQEMSRNGVAGVMFTANPVKFDQGEMVINALRGCGEQIVSGVATPDEILIDRIRKTTSIKVQTDPEGCCLTDGEIQHLKFVGEYLESIFGRPQDIEFVVIGSRISIVQSRDITGLDRESDFELYYEIDSPYFTDREILSNGNVGEVLPVPINIMERDTCCIMFDKIIACMTLREIKDIIPAQSSIGFALHHRKVFINLGEVVLRIWEIVQKDRLTDIVFAGETLFNDEMFRQAAQRFGNAPKNFAIKRLINMIKIVFYTSYKNVEAIKKVSKDCENLILDKNASVEQLIDAFDKQQYFWCDAILYHTELSVFSSFTYVLCGMLIRGSDHGSLSDDDISDFANVFSNNSRSDVISADVPNSLKRLAEAIKSDDLAEKVISAKDHKEAIEIIRTGESARQQFEDFLKIHGHRGPKELYLDATTWEEDTTLLIHTIQSMLGCPETAQKSIVNEDTIIDSLRCKPTGIRRRMLKYFISQTHRGVAFRETAKNHLVHTVNSVRRTCRLLGLKLFEKGYLPDPTLWMHLNIDEIKELNSTRNPKLVIRAIRRRQIAWKFEGLSYPLVSHGHMNPIKAPEIDTTLTTSITLKGTAVCEGKVIGTARVAKNLEEAKLTKPGEILITKYTDICWSPFFPIISGIVTEIGGLLSHGAVVAREYGLPSLIAVNNATQYFKTGDLVELDSIKGTISRLEEE